MASHTFIHIYERADVAADLSEAGAGLVWTLYGVDGMTPTEDEDYGVTPVVYVDGVEADPTDYVFDVGDETTKCTITFTVSQTGNTITCDYKWRYSCTADEDMSAYEVDRESNAAPRKDVNGRFAVTEPYERVSNRVVLLEWTYINNAFWSLLDRISTRAKTTFDIEVSSEDSPNDRINGLYAISYPTWACLPGYPCRYNAALSAMQLEETGGA